MTLWEAQAVDGVTGVLRSVEGLPWGNFLEDSRSLLLEIVQLAGQSFDNHD
jgi:hypothetical protein